MFWVTKSALFKHTRQTLLEKFINTLLGWA